MSKNSSANNNKNKYVPGDITTYINQHPSRSVLYTKKNSQDKCESIMMNETVPQKEKISLEPIVEKPKRSSSRTSIKMREARSKSAFAAAFHNFQTAKKMHQDNLDHQPLPDAILDRAFLKAQSQGATNPGLNLDVQDAATGLGYKSYKAGPTQCTKLRVYRPKTCGVIPTHMDQSTMAEADGETMKLLKKAGPMDLAIRWDFKPRREPRISRRIDGTNDKVPAVFNRVKPIPENKENLQQFGRSEGVFMNTMGEVDFFDRDLILKRKEHVNKYEKERTCTCGTSIASFNNVPGNESVKSVELRPKSSKTDSLVMLQNGGQRRCKSSPNLSVLVNQSEKLAEIKSGMTKEEIMSTAVNNLPRELTEVKRIPRQPKYAHQTIPRLCHQMKQDYEKMLKKYFLTQEAIIQQDENNNFTPMPSRKVKPLICVPKPKQPYVKKNYMISTLSPPFCSWTGEQSEYPNHWRLASIYQHAYKPVENRKRSLLQSVYQ